MKLLTKLLSGVLMLSMAATTASAASVGLNTHWGHKNFATPYIELANGVNVKWIRDGYGWSSVEQTKGIYYMPHPEHGNMPQIAEDSDIGMVFVLGFGNCLYDGCESSQEHKVIPYEGEYLDAWCSYVRFIAEKYKGLIDVYEVWNEPDILDFNSTSVSGADYVNLLKVTKEIIDEVDPDAKVAGGVVTNEGPFKRGKSTHEYLEEILAAGGGEYMDIVSVHLYTQKFTQDGTDGNCIYENNEKTPEIAYRDWLYNFEKSLDKYNFTKDIWLTEAGWFTGDATYAVTEEVQARYLIRSAVLWENYLKENGRSGEMIQYQAQDGSADGNLYGITYNNGDEKIAYYALKAYNTLLEDMCFDSLLEDSNKYLAKYTSSKNDDIVYVAWCADDTDSVEVPLSGEMTYIYDYRGNLIEKVSSSEGTKTVSVNGYPKFIECVNLRTVIDTVTYNKSKNIITVEGRSNVGDVVNISVEADGTVIQSETVEVNDNEFKASFSLKQDGNLILSTYCGEIVDTKSVKIEFGNAKPSINSGVISVYNESTGLIEVSGSWENYGEDTEASIVVVPADTNRPFEISEVLYIGQTELVDGRFKHSFRFPISQSGVFDMMLSGTGIEDAQITELTIPKTKTYTAELSSSDVTDLKISASVNLTNYTGAKKDAVLIICQYDESMRMLSSSVATAEIPAMSGGTPGTGTVSGNAVAEEGAKHIKAFVWEELDILSPIAEPITLR